VIRELYDWVKNIYTTPSAEAIALRELEDSKRKLLEAQSGREYADSMCKYYEAKIKRLTVYLHKATEEQS
jgi:predicted glycosyltransferase